MKKYLVTGGAGFIGSNFVLHMLEKYEDILLVNVDKLTYAGNLENLSMIEGDKRHIFIQADICDKSAMLDIFKKYDFDYVVNFAAESHVDRSIKNPQIFLDTNVKGTVNLLQCAKICWLNGSQEESDEYKSGVKFLQVSTDEVYGTLSTEEPDTFFTEETPLDPHSPYSASKASADLFVQSFADTFNFPMNITRCSNNYGPFQFPEKLIPLMLNNCLENKDLPVYGDGMQIRDWLYVRDHCKAIDLVLHKGKLSEIYNVGGHNEKTNIYIVESIIRYIHDNVNDSVSEDLIKHVTDRKGHDRRYGIDPSKITLDLGWKPETMFDDGIKITLQWYLDNQTWVKNVVSGDYMSYYKNMYSKKEVL